VCSPLQKEVHYFDNKYYKDLEWYSRFFRKLEGNSRAKKNFETSPYYLYHPAVPERVAETMPEAKLVVVLRNPVDRAISQYKWMCQIGLESRNAVLAFRRDVEKLDLEKDPVYLEQFQDPLHFDFDHIYRSYIRRSLYHVQLKRWLGHFPASQIRLVDSVTLFDYTRAVVQELASFLNVELKEPTYEGSINQNSSKSDVHIPSEARDIAQKHLTDVEERVRALVTKDMVIGEGLCLN
jgi:hypothetical protein